MVDYPAHPHSAKSSPTSSIAAAVVSAAISTHTPLFFTVVIFFFPTLFLRQLDTNGGNVIRWISMIIGSD